MPTVTRKPTRPAARRARPATAGTPAPAVKAAAPAPAAEPAARALAAKVPGAAPAATPAAAADKPAKTKKEPKAEKPRIKLVRDSFTMPEADFALIGRLKARALEAQRPAKKSELLRAGLHALMGHEPARLAAALDALAPIKTGRPKKGH
jgi:hypothetical protein